MGFIVMYRLLYIQRKYNGRIHYMVNNVNNNRVKYKLM